MRFLPSHSAFISKWFKLRSLRLSNKDKMSHFSLTILSRELNRILFYFQIDCWLQSFWIKFWLVTLAFAWFPRDSVCFPERFCRQVRLSGAISYANGLCYGMDFTYKIDKVGSSSKSYPTGCAIRYVLQTKKIKINFNHISKQTTLAMGLDWMCRQRVVFSLDKRKTNHLEFVRELHAI